MKSRTFENETIAAISTPPGEGGIGVVRLSGKEALGVADRIFRAKSGKKPSEQKPYTAQFGNAVSENGGIIDEALLLVMRAPKSYTCEDMAELSAHGGSAVMAAVLESALRAGARLAEPGEFTKRAFLNGRLDLLQAEAVLDLIQSKTELGRRWAAAQLVGSLSKKIKALKDGLVEVLSHLEASIDFPDDLPDTDPLPKLRQRLESFRSDVRQLLSSAELGLLAKRGLRVVIWGKPNVGKSSLMNALTKSDRVIVTPYPGTTRDVVEEEMQVRGFPVRLLDTAGVQETEHPIEKEGVERSKKALAGSDLVLFVVDASEPFSEEDGRLFQEARSKKMIAVLNKSDLPGSIRSERVDGLKKEAPLVFCSSLTGAGVEELENEIFRFISNGKADIPQEAVVSTLRQKQVLEKTAEAIDRAVDAEPSPELLAVDVRLALDLLGELVGEVVNDEVLDKIFSRFCIGK